MSGGDSRGRSECSHFLLNLDLLLLLLKVGVDVDALLSHDLSLDAKEAELSELLDRSELGGKLTFSIANSSSALTLISRAFSRASCLMKAV